MAGSLLGKGAVVTDPTQYNAADIVALFREKGAEVFAESWDMTKPEMADEIVREAGHVDIPIANLAYPHTYRAGPLLVHPRPRRTRRQALSRKPGR